MLSHTFSVLPSYCTTFKHYQSHTASLSSPAPSPLTHSPILCHTFSHSPSLSHTPSSIHFLSHTPNTHRTVLQLLSQHSPCYLMVAGRQAGPHSAPQLCAQQPCLRTDTPTTACPSVPRPTQLPIQGLTSPPPYLGLSLFSIPHREAGQRPSQLPIHLPLR